MRFTFFADRNLGRRFPELLRAEGLHVVRHDDRFKPATPDEEWLKTAGEEGWVVLTLDQRIRYRPNELEAVRRHRVSMLIVVGPVHLEVLARNFIATSSAIDAFLDLHDPPFVGRVTRPSPRDISRNPNAPGRVSLAWPRS